MKRLISILCVLAMVLTLLPATVAAAETDSVDFAVLSTTDMHGKCWDKNVLTDGNESNNMLRVATAVKGFREEFGENLLVIDNGDLYQGTPVSVVQLNKLITGESDLPAAMALCLAEIGYDVSVLGNHEFNYPWATMSGIYSYLEERGVPIVTANLYYDGSDGVHAAGENVFTPYLVKTITLGGSQHKIGVLGLENTDCTRWDIPDNYPGIVFAHPDNEQLSMAWEVQRYVPMMQAEGCEFIIVSYHSGTGPATGTLTFGVNTEDQVTRMINECEGIDMVIAGHDHSSAYSNTYINDKNGKPVLVVNGGGKDLTKSVFTFTLGEDNKLAYTVKETKNLSLGSFSSDADLKAKIQPYADMATEYVNQTAGTAVGDWDTSSNYYLQQTDTMDLINGAQIDYGTKYMAKKYDTDEKKAALYEKTGLDHIEVDMSSTSAVTNNNYYVHPGPITMKTIVQMYKYDNNVLYLLPLTGQQIKDILEQNAATRLKAIVKNGAVTYSTIGEDFTNPVFGGLNFTYDMYQPEGSRVIIDGFSNGREFALDKTYVVACNSYHLGNTGCGFGAYSTADSIWNQNDDLAGGNVQEVLFEYISEKGEITTDPFTWSWKLDYTGDLDAPAPFAGDFAAQKVEAVEDGDEIVIYYDAEATVIGQDPAENSARLSAVDTTSYNDYIAFSDKAAIFTVEKVEGENDPFLLKSDKGYLTAGPTGNSLGFAEEATECSQWYLVAVEGGFHIMNVGAAYSGNHNQALEWYTGFTTYGVKDTKVYLFNIYKLVDLYPLWVGGVQVTPKNAADVFGDGKVRFTLPQGEEPAILELNNYSYTGEGVLIEGKNGLLSAALCYDWDVPLEIRFTGENTLIQTSDKDVRISAGIFNHAMEVDLALVGMDEAASLTAVCGSSMVFSNTLASNGGLRIADLQLDLTSGEAGDESDAVYCLGSLQITRCELRAVAGDGAGEGANFSVGLCTNANMEIEDSYINLKSGDNVKSSCTLDSIGDMTILGSTIEAVTGNGTEFCIGLHLGTSLQIDDSEIFVDTTTEDALASYPIDARNGSIRIRNSTVTVKCAGGAYNAGISAGEDGLEIIDSTVAAEAGPASNYSVAISVYGDITISGTSEVTVIASDTLVTGEDQTYSCGIECMNMSISGIGTKVSAVAGAGDTSHALVANETLTITDEVEYVEAVSPGRAVYGLVKNGIPGTGWTDVEGTGEGEAIPVSAEGAEFPDYQKVVFQGAHYYQLWVGGVQVTSENAADVFGDGKVRFTPAEGEEPAILELDSYSYAGPGCAVLVGDKLVSGAVFYNEEAPVEVRLTGENVLTLEDRETLVFNAMAIFLRTADSAIVGADGASLTASCGTAESVSAVIAGKGELRIENVKLDLVCSDTQNFSYGIYADKGLTLEGSEIIAKCGAAPVGSYAVYAAGGSILIKDCNLQARAGKANHSIGIYSYNSDITISGGEVVAASSPGAGSSSYGIYTYVGSISITDANVGGAAYGATEYCKGIYAGESISIINSEVLGATSTSENTPEYSDGIEAFNGSITIQNSKVRGAAGPGVYESIGIYAFTGIEILGESEIIAQGRDAADETIGCSAGILCFSSITIDGDCVVAAMGLKGFESYGIAAYDWEEESGSASLNILGGSVLALSQNSETGVGIYTSTLNISENANAVAAVGLDRAVYGTVKNALAGTGWDNFDGDGDGEAIPVNTEGAELPAYKSVRFEKAAAPLENPFDDVTESDYFYEPVLWAVNHEPQITNGTDPGKFSPNAKCTRGQVVTFLWRAKGCPEPTATENPFSDVKDSEYYYKAVLWAVENEITTGTGNGKFSPNQGCTRGQVVTFLWRTEGKPEPAATENPFNDVKDSDYFYTAVLWAVENGITQGTDPGKFSPNATCTRGQIVTFLYRDLAA